MGINIVEEIRKFVELECKKPTSKYGYEPYKMHFIPVSKYVKYLAEIKGADAEIVEIAALGHDIGSIIYGRDKHHITGVKIIGKKLLELNYPKDKIKKVLHCILAHRGSNGIKPKTLEAEIVAEADAINSFDRLDGLFKAAFVYEKLDQLEAKESVREKLINKWNQLSLEGKELVKSKYEAAMLLLK